MKSRKEKRYIGHQCITNTKVCCSTRAIILPCQKYLLRFIFSACLLLVPLSRAALNQKIGSRGSKHSACTMLCDSDGYDMMIKTLYLPPQNNLSLQTRSFENGATFLGQDIHFPSPWTTALSFSTPTGKKASTKDYSNLIIFTYSKCGKKCVAVEPSLFHCGCIYLWTPIPNYRIHFVELSVGNSVNINDSDDIDDNNM